MTKIVQPLSPKKTLTNSAAAAAAAASSSSLSTTPTPQSVVQQLEPQKKEEVVAVKKAVDEVPYVKPVPGSTLRCLEDPIFTETLPVASKVSAAVASNEIEGRDRFDRFWGGGKDTATNGGDEQKTAN